ncbi:hypothetical protein CC1G_15682 [Coprinopsis cinerea okayama7|uniref:Uncharacterized protein n=1 Tax=Coprinopsis cinerea (strain Okayama-7 / 130 / ATCC MYA-4618 / FGSC 9003) TaxID=240176 RepID=D6RQE3_COPC7|nr:hypothetical protein CC1G_15682 [Coprinopsis cinerea okayama7\|eukprot:XP_002910253.1 hypothetical protein CC1G_15682 [Coprinopsis cinerea okayama7\
MDIISDTGLPPTSNKASQHSSAALIEASIKLVVKMKFLSTLIILISATAIALASPIEILDVAARSPEAAPSPQCPRKNCH